jgi:hypothetical protein
MFGRPYMSCLPCWCNPVLNVILHAIDKVLALQEYSFFPIVSRIFREKMLGNVLVQHIQKLLHMSLSYDKSESKYLQVQVLCSLKGHLRFQYLLIWVKWKQNKNMRIKGQPNMQICIKITCYKLSIGRPRFHYDWVEPKVHFEFCLLSQALTWNFCMWLTLEVENISMKILPMSS